MATRKNSSTAAPVVSAQAEHAISTTPIAAPVARRVPLDQLHALLTEAAILADETDESCKSIPNEFDEDQILRHIDRLRDIVCRLGWMADLSLKVIGESTVRGDAEHWLIGFVARGDDNNTFLVFDETHKGGKAVSA